MSPYCNVSVNLPDVTNNTAMHRAVLESAESMYFKALLVFGADLSE